MNPGLPGLGIGGLFYLVSALLMPVWALVRSVRGEPARWGLAWRQAAMAAAILTSMALTFLALDTLLGPSEVANSFGNAVAAAAGGRRISIMVMSLAVLATVLTSVHLLRLVVKRQRPARVQAREAQ
jgi:hypothetical protein